MRRTLLAILIVLTAVAAYVYTIFSRDLTGARARLAGRSQTIQTSFGTVEYAVLGEGDHWPRAAIALSFRRALAAFAWLPFQI